jgi:HSP20 family protein
MNENTPNASKARSDQGSPESTRGGYYFSPRVDIYETDQELILFADVAGARPEDIDLRYERGELLLHAPVKQEPRSGPLSVQEYDVGDYYRVFHIHEEINAANISAECKKGVLTVHLPKAESVKPKQVRVLGE